MNRLPTGNQELKIQEYLSLGYVYLLVLGILSDAIYYSFVDINILAYSSLLDVLLSPLAALTENLVVPFIMLLLSVLAYYLTIVVSPRLHRKFREKKWYRKLYNIDKLDRKYATAPTTRRSVVLLAGFVLAFYLGLGLGRGSALARDVHDSKVEPNFTIQFQNEEQIEAKVIGQNSLYVFYIADGEKKVTIAPVDYNVRSMQKIR